MDVSRADRDCHWSGFGHRSRLPELRKRRGNILNMASGLAIVGTAKQAAYTSAKAGIAGLTRQMAAEYGPQGMRVNAVAPGLIETAATADQLANDADYRNSNIGSMPLMRAASLQRWPEPRHFSAATMQAS